MSTKGIIYNMQRMSVHDGPGLRTTVFFKGCPLHCLWCSNPESQTPAPQLMFFQNLCSGCGHCVRVCRHGAVIEKGGQILRDFSRCVGCGACAEQCPTTASAMSGQTYDVDAIMKVIRKDASFFSNSGGGVTFSGGHQPFKETSMPTLINPADRTYAVNFDGSWLKGMSIHVLNPNGAPNSPNAWVNEHVKVTYYLDPSTVDSRPLSSQVEFFGGEGGSTLPGILRDIPFLTTA